MIAKLHTLCARRQVDNVQLFKRKRSGWIHYCDAGRYGGKFEPSIRSTISCYQWWSSNPLKQDTVALETVKRLAGIIPERFKASFPWLPQAETTINKTPHMLRKLLHLREGFHCERKQLGSEMIVHYKIVGFLENGDRVRQRRSNLAFDSTFFAEFQGTRKNFV